MEDIIIVHRKYQTYSMAFRERCVYVTGLALGTKGKDLEKLFRSVGVLKRSALIRDDKEVFTGKAFICLRTKEEA